MMECDADDSSEKSKPELIDRKDDNMWEMKTMRKKNRWVKQIYK